MQVLTLSTRMIILRTWTLFTIIVLAKSQQICNLTNTDRSWMCKDCASVTACRDIFNIVGSKDCSKDDLKRFNQMFNLLIHRVPDSEKHRVSYTGQASCTLGSTIALSLHHIYGNDCPSGQTPQLNAAGTHIFCMCKSRQCDAEYTDHVLNILLGTIVVLLTLYLLINGWGCYMKSTPKKKQLPCSEELDQQSLLTRHWTRMNRGER